MKIGCGFFAVISIAEKSQSLQKEKGLETVAKLFITVWILGRNQIYIIWLQV